MIMEHNHDNREGGKGPPQKKLGKRFLVEKETKRLQRSPARKRRERYL
jgi:hypothetical protein